MNHLLKSFLDSLTLFQTLLIYIRRNHMKTLINTLFVLFAVSSFAGGTHDHQHEDDDEAHSHNSPTKSSIGQAAEPANATKTVNVELLDIMKFAFSPALDIAAGDIVRFVVANTGQVRHEFSIGNKEEQKAHSQMMKNMPDMVHEDGNTITVEPGETKEITWHFMGKDTVVFACNIPGHFEAGMHESLTL